MPPRFPSIQSFFPLSSSPTRSSSPTKPTSPTKPDSGDGFTSQEVDAALHPSPEDWIPARDYDEMDIGALIPGPQCVTLIGRVVNFYDQSTQSKMPQAAKGCVKIIVKDDTGALTVRLWYANREYKLRLGHLVSIWTSHVSHSTTDTLAPNSAPLVVTMFPERDRSCHFMVHEQSDEGKLCKTPLGFVEGEAPSRLMTMKNYVNGGWEVEDVRIMVCVKSIGAKKKLDNKKGGVSELVNVGVFDDTADASLTLWGAALLSVDYWVPSETILLISNPGCRLTERFTSISLTKNTHVDIDPIIRDAEWLRKFAQNYRRREHTNPPFPDGVFDLDSTLAGPIRILYNLADVDERIRETPDDVFIGYLSVIILELDIMTLHRRNMLLSTECCGVPLYANNTVAGCKQCEQETQLRINPRLVGTIIDETGSIGSGKLIWSREAWEQLLGRTAQELAGSRTDLLRYLEKRLALLRVTLVFGWAGVDVSGGRLMVMGVRM